MMALGLRRPKKIVDWFVYNPENDTYYMEHGDTNMFSIEVEEEYMDKDGHN